MKSAIKSLIFIFIFIPLFSFKVVYAQHQLPSNLISFASREGLLMFKRSANINTMRLMQNYVTQQYPTYCGIASVTMILNAIQLPAPLDDDHQPDRYFNQKNFFNVLKINKLINVKELEHKGLTLKQLGAILSIYHLKSKIYFADQLNEQQMQKIMTRALSQNQFVIIDFYRPAISQSGKGHHAPIAAYDKVKQRFLVLDVARYKYPPFWITKKDLWHGISHHAANEIGYRGFIVINANRDDNN